MNITQTLYVSNRAEWRDWLEEHYRTEREIWLVYYKKRSGKPRISYSDAVEEALSFGWIDSTAKKLDEERFAQRFTPRNPKSGYSQANRERLRKLIAQGKVKEDVLAALCELPDDSLEIPPDILRALQENQTAWDNFRKFPDAYRRIRIAYIEGARKRPEEFKKRLNNFLRMTEKNKRFGFGIEDFM
jgi:uncharacterized protein YdeI (YjbR/CyaY-like superfamily)